ncbi:hypothetical protein HZA75_04505 [Candidatus Roizmanbacteria bacterium]|nr:hypothetical protein [Candidatus Roizmanbacteria bacterium]
MSNEIIFIILVFLPLFILGFLMTTAQRNFLRSVRKIINPDEPISTAELMKLFVKKFQKPEELIKFIKNDFNKYPGNTINLYWQHYNNPELEKKSNLVRRYTILTFVIPTLGFIIFCLFIIFK